jgi:hypothetical protein
MLSEVEASLVFLFGRALRWGTTVRDGKPDLADFVGYVTASTVLRFGKTSLRMTREKGEQQSK